MPYMPVVCAEKTVGRRSALRRVPRVRLRLPRLRVLVAPPCAQAADERVALLRRSMLIEAVRCSVCMEVPVNPITLKQVGHHQGRCVRCVRGVGGEGDASPPSSRRESVAHASPPL
jgi:hypothetical protein